MSTSAPPPVSLNRTQGFFHDYAGDFDAIYSNRTGLFNNIVNNLFRKSMKLRFMKTIEGCQPAAGRSVLDVGCGPGHYSITLARDGASRVLGIDFADGMLEIAAEHAEKAGVSSQCEFRVADFSQFNPAEKFDYVVVMGFMDYMKEPERVISKALSLTAVKAFFSFPVAGGLLGWQRRLRYRSRCDLFLYNRRQLERLCAKFPRFRARIEQIDRDFFVTFSRIS